MKGSWRIAQKSVLVMALSLPLIHCGGGTDTSLLAESTPIPLATATPVATVTPTLEPTPAATPTAVSPNPTPDPTPDPTPHPTPHPTPDPSPSPSISPEPSQRISGTISYDFVPHSPTGALDYANMEIRPVREAKVQLLASDGSVLATSKTDQLGAYSFSVTANTDLRVRAWAQLIYSDNVIQPTQNQITVADNTNDNAPYVLDGSLINSGSTDSVRDLHAASGWNGTTYAGTRAAAPFAILDSVYQAMSLLLQSDPGLTVSNIELRWSINNIAVDGDLSSGQVGTSFFNGNAIYILGHADNDTDEYDRSVVQHEFAHFLEHDISRSDSIGGPHSGSSKNDMRVSFSEGFANAFTAIVSGAGHYEDSAGSQQALGFRFSLEDNTHSNRGFYTENAIGSVVYDIFDNANDGQDIISLGFDPVYHTLTSSTYTDANALTSIYLFASVLRQSLSPEDAAGLDAIMNEQQIFGTGAYGSNETNDGGVDNILPIYASLQVNQSVNICSNNAEGAYNGVDVRRFIRVDLNDSASYTISMQKISGGGTRDPDIVIFQNGNTTARLESGEADNESDSISLSAGSYIFEAYDFNNLDDSGATGPACFTVSIN